MIKAWTHFFVTKNKWKKIFGDVERTLFTKMSYVETYSKEDVYFLLGEVDRLTACLNYAQKELNHDESLQAVLCAQQRIADLEIDQLRLMDKLKNKERTDANAPNNS